MPVDPGPMAAHAHRSPALRSAPATCAPSALDGAPGRTGARAGRAAGRRPRDGHGARRCGPGPRDRRAGRHRRLRDEGRRGALGRRRGGRGRRRVWSGTGSRSWWREGADVRPHDRVEPGCRGPCRAPGDAGPRAARRGAGPAGRPDRRSPRRCHRAGGGAGLLGRAGAAPRGRPAAVPRAPGCSRATAMLLESGDRLHRWLGAGDPRAARSRPVSRPRGRSRRPRPA